MFGWLLRRLGQVVPTLLILSLFVFGLQQLMPGDPALIMAGEERGDPEVLAQIRAELMLDRPVWEQYLAWLFRLLHGDLGFSWRIRQPVTELILQKLPVTLQLGAMAFVIAVAIGVPLGVLSAVKRDRPLDWIANGLALAGISTPNFWLGIMMILLFSVQLGWLPPSGYVPLTEDWRQSLATTIMPAFVLGNSIAGVLMRHTRAAMLGALGQEVVLQAGANALQVGAQPGVVEVVAGTFLRSGTGGVLGEAVDQVELAGERGELLTLRGEAVGSDGRLQRRERHSQHHGKRRPCGCAAVGLSHRAIPR